MSNAGKILLISDVAVTDRHLIADLRLLTEAPEPELLGLFIKDPRVLQAMSITQVKFVNHKGDIAGVSVAECISAMEDTARQQGQTLLDAARREGYAADFQVVEGAPETLLDAHGREAALVVVTRPDLPGRLRSRPAAEIVAALPAEQPMLFVNAPWRSGRAVVVHLAAGEEVQTAAALRVAARYAQAARLSLDLALDPAAPAPPVDYSGLLNVHRGNWTDTSLGRLCATVDARLLVLSGTPAQSQAGAAEGLLGTVLARLCDQLSCSILWFPRAARG